MLKIAVCDDNPEHLDDMMGWLERYLRARPEVEAQPAAFQSGEALLKRAIAQRGFDLYLMDVLMPGLDGIQAGRRLRELGDGGEIIYLSSSDEFAVQSYDVRAFFYLLKPLSEERLFQVLDEAVEKLNRRRNGGIVVATPSGPRRILLERIRYVERVGRSMRYYCVDGSVDSQTIHASFREMAAPLLADPRFYLCGASFVFNFQRVTGVSGQAALLDDGSRISLPRKAVAAFKTAWGRYWLGTMRSWRAPLEEGEDAN